MTRQPHPTTNNLRTLLYTMLVAVLIAAVGPITGLHAQDGAEPLPAGPRDPDAPDAEEKKGPAPETLTDKLGGDDRYLTHLSTDKPIYRAGETVYARGTILHAFSRKPIEDNQQEIRRLEKEVNELGPGDNDQVRQKRRELWQRLAVIRQQNNLNPTVEIKDPKGAVLTTGVAQVEDSVFGFSWVVPDGQAGGEYTIKVTYPWSGLAPAERTFDIRAYRPPRIKTQIDFLKDGYGPGDTVIATVKATRAEGGTPEGAKVTAIARVDGQEVARVATMVRENGMAEARFELPAEIERGEGSLAFVIEDGGVIETASKTLPILLQTVDLRLYPEGGDLVAGAFVGLENRIFFEARTPFGKPADIEGRIVEGIEVDGVVEWAPVEATFETSHEGRGVFAIKMKQGVRYGMQVTKPASVTEVFELPAAKARGARIVPWKGLIDGRTGIDAIADWKRGHTCGVFAFDEAISLQVFAPGHESIALFVTQREKVLWSQTFDDIDQKEDHGLLQGVPDTMLPGVEGLPAAATGILTVTAYDADGNPLAERLIYRAPKDHINIEIMPDSARYTPSGRVRLTIKTTGANGEPVSAVAGLTVTDDAVLEMIETREQAPSLPAMVFLEQEVDDLADAHVYLDPDNPDAAQQLDLLLGTQGWRRFALVNVEDFILEHGDDARRLLALRVPVREELLRVRRNAGGFAELEGAEEAAFELAEDAAPVPQAQQAEPADKAADAPADPDAPPVPEPPAERLDLQEALEQANKDEAGEALFDEAEADLIVARQRAFPQMVFIREYAHKQPAGKPFGQRSDFTETVYWSAATKTNDAGLATIEFDLSDSVTSFRVKADAFTQGGALGANSELIESVRPFYVEPKLPLELTAGDKVLLPIAMVNNTNQELPVELIVSRLGKAGTDTLDPVALAADTRGRSVVELIIGETFGDLGFNIEARAGALFDVNQRRLRVVPKGFPISDGSGGMLQPDGEAKDEVTIPDTVVPGSLHASVTVYPTPMANLTEALEALIRDPYGCFEQTSSTTFPLVMAQQYFLSHQGIDPALIAKAQEKLDKGYQRLIGFETEQKGYEWFGSTPPHEALTAYGLLQFNEMKQVMDVDQQMIDRTADWLMSRRDGEGSFKLDSKALDSFGRAPQETTNAYIVWSMLEAGYDYKKIKTEIDHVLEEAVESNDMYIVALGANIAHLTFVAEFGDVVDPNSQKAVLPVSYVQRDRLLKKLAGKLTDEGFVDGAVTSITRSGGDALRIETTSLAILAWLRDDAYTNQVERSILWLTERCKAGRFGSTQSTVLALKAIVEYDKARSTPKAPGSLILLVNGEPFGEPVEFNEETKGAIKLPDPTEKLTPGKHTIAVLMDGGSKMPYTIAVDYFANTPASSEECALRIETRVEPTLITSAVNQVAIVEGETTEVNVKVTNVTKEGLPTPIAIVGIPGGLEPDYDQLKELVAAGTIASFEVIGRDVVLYWREMKPEASVELQIRCTAAVPGTYTGPASRAYLYYTDEFKDWTEGLKVTITPREAK